MLRSGEPSRSARSWNHEDPASTSSRRRSAAATWSTKCVVGELDPAGRLGPSNQVGRVLSGPPPCLVVVAAVDSVEDRSQLAIPRPVQVGGETREYRERIWDLAGDRELVGGAHRRRSVTARNITWCSGSLGESAIRRTRPADDADRRDQPASSTRADAARRRLRGEDRRGRTDVEPHHRRRGSGGDARSRGHVERAARRRRRWPGPGLHGPGGARRPPRPGHSVSSTHSHP